MDLQNDVIAIKGTKTKYDRYIPVSIPLKSLLSNVERKSEYVFTGINGKVKEFKDSFKSACRNAELKDLRIHDLRHVFASKMVMNGTSFYITGELLWHRTTQMTKRYSHLVPETLKKAVDDVRAKSDKKVLYLLVFKPALNSKFGRIFSAFLKKFFHQFFFVYT